MLGLNGNKISRKCKNYGAQAGLYAVLRTSFRRFAGYLAAIPGAPYGNQLPNFSNQTTPATTIISFYTIAF